MFYLSKKYKPQLPKSIICFETYKIIDEYLYSNNGTLQFRMLGIPDEIKFDLYSFPSSLSDPQNQKLLVKHNLSHSFELLNTFYKKTGIDPISKEVYNSNSEFYYMQIGFSSAPPPSQREYLTSVAHTFFITLCCTSNPNEQNDFRMMYYSGYFHDYVRGFLNAKSFNLQQMKEEREINAGAQLEKVLFGFFEYTQSSLPAGISNTEYTNLVIKNITIADYENFLSLLSQGVLPKNEIYKQATILKEVCETSEYPYEMYEMMQRFTENPAIEHFFWHSDWKFEAEDVQFFVSQMLKQDFSFEYPADTYSHSLFPFIQSALKNKNKELVSINTMSDSYIFFLIDVSKREHLFNLSQKINVIINELR